ISLTSSPGTYERNSPKSRLRPLETKTYSPSNRVRGLRWAKMNIFDFTRRRRLGMRCPLRRLHGREHCINDGFHGDPFNHGIEPEHYSVAQDPMGQFLDVLRNDVIPPAQECQRPRRLAEGNARPRTCTELDEVGQTGLQVLGGMTGHIGQANDVPDDGRINLNPLDEFLPLDNRVKGSRCRRLLRCAEHPGIYAPDDFGFL